MADETQDHARRAQEGSEESFTRLFERLQPALETWARVRVKGPMARHADPDDLVQEVWWRAVEKFPSYDAERASFRAWLFGIASNVLREMIRRGTRLAADSPKRGTSQLDQLGPELRAQLTSITKRARRSENVNKLMLFVQELDPEDQRLFIHRGLEGLPSKEVGMILGISENATTKRWGRLREQLSRLSVWREFEADA